MGEYSKVELFIKFRDWLLENNVKPVETPYGNYWIMLADEEFVKECMDELNNTICSTSTPQFSWDDNDFRKLSEYAINVFNAVENGVNKETKIDTYISVLPFKNIRFICNEIAVCVKDNKYGGD